MGMLKLTKVPLSLYLKTDCQRQLVYGLHPPAALTRRGLPKEVQSNIGWRDTSIRLLGNSGHQHQTVRNEQLRLISDLGVRDHGPDPDQEGHLLAMPLEGALLLAAAARSSLALLEAEFRPSPGSFAAFGLTQAQLTGEVSLSEIAGGSMVLDLLEVTPGALMSGMLISGGCGRVRADGRVDALSPDAAAALTWLRVVDVKLSEKPNRGQFAEVAWYSVLLAAWVEQRGLSDRFAVLDRPAIWSGPVDAQPSPRTVAELHAQLAVMPFALLWQDLGPLLRDTLPALLARDPADLDWHVGASCSGCSFYGVLPPDTAIAVHPEGEEAAGAQPEQPARAPHCLPQLMAGGLLSQVAGLSPAHASELRSLGIHTVEALAGLPADRSPGMTTGLQRRWPDLRRRAQSLVSGKVISLSPVELPGLAGFVNLDLAVTVEWDPPSGRLGMLGLSGTWWPGRTPAGSVPVTPEGPLLGDPETGELLEGAQLPVDVPARQRWSGEAFTWSSGSAALADEEALLSGFLTAFEGILAEVRGLDAARGQRSRVQLTLWESAQAQRLEAGLRRHPELRSRFPFAARLLWDALLGMVSSLVDGQVIPDRRAGVGVNLLRTQLELAYAFPIPVRWGLFDVLELFVDHVSRPAPLFSDVFSHQFPAERLQEHWQNAGGPGGNAEWVASEMVRKLSALLRLTGYLRSKLHAQGVVLGLAPKVSVPDDLKVSASFTPLIERLRANQRLSGRFSQEKAIRRLSDPVGAVLSGEAALLRPLRGAQADRHRQRMAAQGVDFNPMDDLMFELDVSATQLTLRPGQLGFLLVPASDPGVALRKVRSLPPVQALQARKRALPFGPRHLSRPLWEMPDFEPKMTYLDVVSRVVVLRFSVQGHLVLQAVGFDPGQGEWFLTRMQRDLQGPGIGRTLGQLGLMKGRNHPVWRSVLSAQRPLTAPRSAPLSEVLSSLAAPLNSGQAQAFTSALTNPLTLIWGPPGTGKTKTLSVIITGLVRQARLAGRPLKLLCTSGTYAAVDTLLGALAPELPGLGVRVFRVASPGHPLAVPLPGVTTLETRTDQDAPALQALREELDGSGEDGLVLFMSVSSLTALARIPGADDEARKDEALVSPMFTALLIDEASQLDLTGSLMAFSKLVEGGTVVVAGDDRQLPPVRVLPVAEVDPLPLGSLYSWLIGLGHTPVLLPVNYRSGRQVVSLAHLAGYDPSLHSHTPGATLGLQDHEGLNSVARTLLDPGRPVVLLRHDDTRAAGVDPEELRLISALLRDLPGRLLGVDGQPLTGEAFWRRGVGLVAPHRRLVAELQSQLMRDHYPHGTTPELQAAVMGAVDTVERFQGQERELMVIVFGIGDRDLIRGEEAFLLDLRRLNVMISRARRHVVLIASSGLLSHVPEDPVHLEPLGYLRTLYDGLTCEGQVQVDGSPRVFEIYSR